MAETTPSVYECEDYRLYLEQRITGSGNARGYRTQLAKAAGCHSSFLSQVFKGSVQLLPEHALGLARFWGLSENETEYFVLLVQHSRAGTLALRNWTKEKMLQAKGRNVGMKESFRQSSRLGDRAQEIYYSTWEFSAIHVLCGIPEFQTARAIARALRMSDVRANRVLRELEKLSLVRREKTQGGSDQWARGDAHVHLDSDSLFVGSHHLQWRLRLSQEIAENRAENLHFTGVHSVSAADARRMRQMLVECLDRVGQLSRPSPEEELVAITCDFSRMTARPSS